MKLVELGHFTQTANSLFMTQSGVSQHIKKLENQLDVLLLNRYGKQFELTLAGQKVYQIGLQMTQLETQLQQQIQHDAPWQGSCSIACSGSLANLLYPHFIEQQKKYPQLNIFVEAAPNQNILNDLIENKVELGIVTVISSDQQLVQQEVGKESLLLVVPADFEVDDGDLYLQLNKLGFIDHPDGMHFVEKVFSVNFSTQFQGTTALYKSGYINQLQQILLPVASGLGYTILPSSAVMQFNQPENIRVLTLPKQVQETLYLSKKRYRPLAARYQWFEQAIKQLLAE